MSLKVRATLTEVFLWQRWFFLPLGSAVWQPEVAMFLKYNQYSELQQQDGATSLKLNWTKAVYQWSSPPMATQVQEPILVSKTSIQCTVEFLPKMMSSILVLSFSGLVERFLHRTYRKVACAASELNPSIVLYRGLVRMQRRLTEKRWPKTTHEIQFSLCLLCLKFFYFLSRL